MKVLNPLIEGWREGTVRRERRLDAGLRHRSDAGEAQARNQAAGEELAPVDAPLGQFTARRLPKEGFLLIPSTHLSSP